MRAQALYVRVNSIFSSLNSAMFFRVTLSHSSVLNVSPSDGQYLLCRTPTSDRCCQENEKPLCGGNYNFLLYSSNPELVEFIKS